jgi:3-dehydroquinate synthase
MLPPSIQIHQEPTALVESFLKSNAYTQIGLLMDSNTRKFCYPLVQPLLPGHLVIEIQAGEEHKNLGTCTEVWAKLTEHKFDRHSLLLVLGGGVAGDLGGFCAATYKRGIDFVLLPTTLLAQVDASVGGKLGIDFENFKNHIGVFQEPKATLICPTFLATLPDRELRSGFAEIVKHCLISDQTKWNAIRKTGFPNQNWLDLIRHSVDFKAGVIARDPREKGERKILNFGHTVGHAIESLSLTTDQRLFHGEAIAIGMAVESFIAEQKGLLSIAERKQIQEFLLEIYGKTALPDAGMVVELMKQDKKNKGNNMLMALPKGIGQAVWDVEVSEGEVIKALAGYDF